jgi:hypothetical protein
MNVFRTSGNVGRVRICVVLAVVALAGLAVAVGPAMAGQTAANLQAAHAAYITQGTTLGAGSSGGGVLAATPAMIRAALVVSRISGTTLDAGNSGSLVAAVPEPVANAAPAAQPFGKARLVNEPGIGNGMAALVAVAALVVVGLIAGISAKSRSGAAESAAPVTMRSAASAPDTRDDSLRHAA